MEYIKHSIIFIGNKKRYLYIKKNRKSSPLYIKYNNEMILYSDYKKKKNVKGGSRKQDKYLSALNRNVKPGETLGFVLDKFMGKLIQSYKSSFENMKESYYNNMSDKPIHMRDNITIDGNVEYTINQKYKKYDFEGNELPGPPYIKNINILIPIKHMFVSTYDDILKKFKSFIKNYEKRYNPLYTFYRIGEGSFKSDACLMIHEKYITYIDLNSSPIYCSLEFYYAPYVPQFMLKSLIESSGGKWIDISKKNDLYLQLLLDKDTSSTNFNTLPTDIQRKIRDMGDLMKNHNITFNKINEIVLNVIKKYNNKL